VAESADSALRRAVPTGWVQEFELQPVAGHLDRLAGDIELVSELIVAGYEGKTWDRFANALAKYGYQVIWSWIRTGLIFERCREKGLGKYLYKGRPALGIEDIDEIAQDTVVRAVTSFRDRVLVPGKWNPSKGASLKTFFIGACLIEFLSVYRGAAKSIIRRRQREILADELPPSLQSSSGIDPARQALLRAEVASARANVRVARTGTILELIAQGYTQPEIAEMLEVTVKAIESSLARHRRDMKERGIA